MPGGIFTPSPLPVNVAKKTVAGTRVKLIAGRFSAHAFYCAMHFSAKRGIGIACLPSVCPR